MTSRGHSWMRTVRLLVACVAWMCCQAQPGWARATDPIALIVSASATTYAVFEPPAEVIAEVRAPREARPCARRSEAPPEPPQARVEPASASLDPVPPIELYLRNCALLC
jgi:hypothetical protein